jgi:hypothetical protein
MIDLVNFQIYGYPVLMYAMILVTTGAITYATVNADQMPSISDVSLLPPEIAAPPPAISPVQPQPPAPAFPGAPSPIPPVQGGKRRRKTQKQTRKKKKSHSLKRRE